MIRAEVFWPAHARGSRGGTCGTARHHQQCPYGQKSCGTIVVSKQTAEPLPADNLRTSGLLQTFGWEQKHISFSLMRPFRAKCSTNSASARFKEPSPKRISFDKHSSLPELTHRSANHSDSDRVQAKVSGLGTGQTGRVGILVGHYDLPVLPDR